MPRVGPNQRTLRPVVDVLTVRNENNSTGGTCTAVHTEGGLPLVHELDDDVRASALWPDQVHDRIDSEISRVATAGQRG